MITLKHLSTLVTIALMMGMGSAAPVQELDGGQAEILGFVGGYTNDGGGTFGGGLQYGFRPRLLFAGEVGYLTAGTDVSVPGIVDFSSSGFSIDGNAHYLFPLENNSELTPYALGGLGFLRVNTSFGNFLPSSRNSQVGLNLGGGLRWQLNDAWGLRPELKIFVGDGSNVRFSVGAYYRIN